MVSLLLLLAASALLVVSYLVRRRRSGFAQFASRRGLRYETSAASLPPDILSGLSFFQGNWETSLCHLVYGRYGDFDVYMFEFSTKKGPQMNDPETSQTVLAVRIENLPAFRQTPYSSGFGRNNTNTRQAGAHLHEAKTPRFAGSLTRTAPWQIEGSGHWVAFWQPSRVTAPEEAGAFLDEGLGMARNLVNPQNKAPD